MCLYTGIPDVSAQLDFSAQFLDDSAQNRWTFRPNEDDSAQRDGWTIRPNSFTGILSKPFLVGKTIE